MFKCCCLVLALFFSVNLFSQRNFNNYKSDEKVGACLSIGGVAIGLCGFLTPPIYTTAYTPNSISKYSTTRKVVPFHQQGPRFGGIVCGGTLTFAGLITLICGK